MHHRNIAYLIADGAHGRILVWDRDGENYRTCVEIADGPAPVARHHPGTVSESFSHQRHGFDDKEEARKKTRSAFAHVLAEHVRQFAAEHPVEGFVLAAPARVLTPLKGQLKEGPAILGLIGKDLTKHGDHELREALTQAELKTAFV
jgi:protein required for attachment to host cells